MIDPETNGCAFSAVLYDVRVKRDGGGRIQLDFGADALTAIQHLQHLSATGDIVLQIGVCPLPKNNFSPDENGEIPL